MKRLWERLKGASFFYRLLFTTILSGVLSLLFTGIFLVPNLLRAAGENDLAHQRQICRSAADCFDDMLRSADSCRSKLEESKWLHELYIDHVLGGKESSPLKYDIVADLSLMINGGSGVARQIAFRFYREDTLYTNNGVFENAAFYRRQYPDDLHYYFPDGAAGAQKLKLGDFQGQSVLVYHTTFTDVPQGVAKGDVAIVFDMDALARRLDAETDGDVSLAQIRTKDGVPVAALTLRETAQPLRFLTEPSADGRYEYRLGVTEAVYSQTRGRMRPAIVGTIVLVLAICMVISFLMARANYFPVKTLSEKFLGVRDKSGDEFSAMESTFDQLSLQRSEAEAELAQLRPLARQRIINALLTGLIRVENTTVDQIRYCDLAFPHLYFAVVAVSGVVTDASSQSEGANCNSESRMEAMLAGCLDGARVSAYLHYMDDSHYNILLNAASEADVPAAARDLAAHAEQFFRECGLRSALTFGVGSAVSSVSDIYRSAEQASSALNIASGATEERVIFYEELAQRITVGYEYPISAETLLLRAITENNAAAAKSILGDVVANNRARQALSYNSLRLLYFSLCSTVVRSAQSIGIPIEVAPEEQYAERGITLTAIRTRIEALIDKVCAEIARKRSEQGNGSEEQIFDYINQNLYDPDISLTKVADRFHKSPAYISMVFKEKFGTNYSDYVNQNRIVRATELLSQGEMSIEEVCFAAGYVSLSTFRRNFTRYTKGNPGDYLPNKRENKPAKKEE